MTLAAAVDLDRYPIEVPGGPDAAAVIERHRAELAGDGVSILPGFLTPAATQAMAEEADALTGLGHHQDVEGTPYLGLPDPDAPEGDPRRHIERSALTTIARDRFPAGSPLRSLYEDDALLRFVSAVVGRGPLHRYADPLGALNVAVMGDGDELGWHFDSTDFVVSIALRSAEVGGDFEVADRLRRPDDECLDDVAEVLAGDRSRVRTLPMTPGTLMLFEGRHSLHRVTPVAGSTSRLVALLAFDTRPDTDSSDLLKLVRYGRLPESPAGAEGISC